MNRAPVIAALCVAALAWPLRATGQSLAELARKEAERRQSTGSTSTKVITNADLKAVPPPAAGTPAPSLPGTTLPPPPPLPKDDAPGAGDGKGTADAKSPVAPAVDEKKDEKYWRGRVSAARDTIARSETFQQALQARIAALSTDFVNRDDPAQRTAIGTERQKAMAELERVKQDVMQAQSELLKIADEARRAGVPSGWTR